MLAGASAYRRERDGWVYDIRMRRIVVFLCSLAALGQSPLSPRQILEKVRDTYTGVRRFEVTGRVELLRPWQSQAATTIPLRIAAEYPNKLRLEGGGSGLVHAALPGMVVSDGKTTWKYDAQHRAYTRTSGPPALDLDMEDDELAKFGIAPGSSDVVKIGETFFGSFRKLPELAGSAKVLRTETVRLSVGDAECYVIDTKEGEAGATWWIDNKSFRVLRMETSGRLTVRISFSTASLNEPLPDDVFAFVPPVDAQEVEKLP